MKFSDKKIDMADKMYHENSTGGKGSSPKFKMRGEGKGKLSMKYAESSKGSNRSNPKFNQADTEGKITGKYNQ